MSRECSCFDINGFTKDFQEFFRAGASVAEMYLRDIQEDYMRTNANVTYWTYLGRSEIRQDSRFLFPYLSLFYMNSFIKGLCKARVDRSYQYLLPDSFPTASLSFR